MGEKKRKVTYIGRMSSSGGQYTSSTEPNDGNHRMREIEIEQMIEGRLVRMHMQSRRDREQRSASIGDRRRFAATASIA
jgi:hypothetical protein